MKLTALFLLLLAHAFAQLHPGDAFPAFSGGTISGSKLELPSAAKGRAAAVIFSFSRRAGDDARAWTERLVRDFGPAVGSFIVIMLEDVPRLFRGIAASGIEKGMPTALHGHTVIASSDEALWKKRLAVSDLNRSYVILLDAEGRVRWLNASAFSDVEYRHLKEQL